MTDATEPEIELLAQWLIGEQVTEEERTEIIDRLIGGLPPHFFQCEVSAPVDEELALKVAEAMQRRARQYRREHGAWPPYRAATQ